MVNCLPAVKKEMASHSSTHAWKFHGLRSLVDYIPWGRKELDTTERLHFHFHDKYYVLLM